MKADEREMVVFEPELLRVPVQEFLDQRMKGAATRALIITEFDQRQCRIFRTAKVSATPDIRVQRGCGSFRRLVGLPAEINGGTGGDRDCQDDYNQWFEGFWHAYIVAAKPGVFEKISCNGNAPR